MTQPPNQVKEENTASITASTASLPARSDLRRQLRHQRSAIAVSTKQDWDKAIARRLCELVLEKRPHRLAVYWPIQSEPMLLDCFAELHQSGIALALPIVLAKGQPLKFVAWTPSQAMEDDVYGIPMPVERETAVVPDMVLAPCVGFNQDNYRLGYGGGFYDRTLALYPQAFSIGIAYELSQTAFQPDHYDIALNLVLTERATYSREK